MYKVKVFDEEHEDDLENTVNAFLETIPEDKVKDIQFQVAVDDPPGHEIIYCFSAMIVYHGN